MKEESFLDKNTLISVALVFVAWLCWDAYMRKKYPQKVAPPPSQSPVLAKDKPLIQKTTRFTQKAEDFKETLNTEKTFLFESDNLSFTLSSRGMGFKEVVLNRILDRKGQAVYLFSDEPEGLAFETRFVRHLPALFFDIQRVSQNRFEGKAKWKGVEVKKTLTVEPENFLVKAYLQLTGDLSQIHGVSTWLSQSGSEEEPKKKLAFFFDTPGFFIFFCLYS